MATAPSPPAAQRGVIARKALAVLALAFAAVATAEQPVAGSAPALRAAWARLAIAGSEDRPDPSFVVASAQSAGDLSGSLHGVLARSFAEVEAGLATPEAWCEVLILDPNVHRCRPRSGAAVPTIEVAFGQPAKPIVMEFAHAATPDYLRVSLAAADGPFGTRDYRMTLEAAPLPQGGTVVQLGFAQQLGLAARLAMVAYFHTVARGKVGFTVEDHEGSERPARVGGLRGGLERNLVRQWLALGAYLDTRAGAPGGLAERRVRDWLAGTERFPQQLREEAGYAARKVPEVRRQLAGE